MENLEQPNDLGSKNENFGKFKDAESLLNAYNNLESEFTKKSQRLAQLEDEKDLREIEIIKKADIDERVENYCNKFELVRPFKEKLKENLTRDENLNLEDEILSLISTSCNNAEGFIRDEEFLNNYVYSNQEIKDKIIKEYISKITQNSPIKVESGATSIPLSPPRVPTTIREAGNLAKTIIKQK